MLLGQTLHIPRQPQQPGRVFTVRLKGQARTRLRLCSLAPSHLSPSLRTTFVPTGAFRGVCKKIDHFPDDADYDQDTAEYLLRELPDSRFPIPGSPLGGGKDALESPSCL